MSIARLLDSTIQGWYNSLQQIAALCRRNFGAWVRQNIVDEDPYDCYEQQLLMQRILEEAENCLLNPAIQNHPVTQGHVECSEVSIDSQKSPPWLNSSHLLSIYLDLKEMSRQCNSLHF